MRININIKGEKESFNIINKWEDCTLGNLQRLLAYQDLDEGSKAINTVNLFSDIPKKMIKKLSIQDIAQVLSYINQLESEKDTGHTATFTLNGKRYGFIPSLEDISLGEFADIETFIKQGVEKNLPNIMSVLFRPITEESKGNYKIEVYDGESQKERAKEFLEMSAVQVQNSMVFFCNFVNKLLVILESYLEEVKTVKERRRK